MRLRILAFAVAASAAAAFTACAQESAPPTPPAQDAVPPAAQGAPKPGGAALEAGAQVTDAAGREIGTVQSVADGTDGQTVIVQIDGQLYGLPASTFSTASGKIVSRNTKDQIKAASRPQP